MRYKVLHCAGYEQAVLGMMLSYGKTSFDDFTATDEDRDRVATKLAPMDGGHNKFLEQIQYWICSKNLLCPPSIGASFAASCSMSLYNALKLSNDVLP